MSGRIRIGRAYKLSQRLARESGEIALRMRDGCETLKPEPQTNLEALADIYTRADIKSQEFILRGIIDARLHDSRVCAEEKYRKSSVRKFSMRGPYTWYIDPIDGTLNFKGGSADRDVRADIEDILRALGHRPSEEVRPDEWGPMIGMTRYDECEFGVIYLPKQEKLFHARREHGAYLAYRGNTSRIQTSQRDRFHIDDTIFVNSRIYKQLPMHSTLRIRRHGSYAHTAGLVASGQRVAIISEKPEEYDVVPAICIVREAGGVVLDVDGRPASLSSRFMVFGPNESYVKSVIESFRQRFSLL